MKKQPKAKRPRKVVIHGKPPLVQVSWDGTATIHTRNWEKELEAAEADKRILLQTILELKAENQKAMDQLFDAENKCVGLKAEIERREADLECAKFNNQQYQEMIYDQFHPMLDVLCRALEKASRYHQQDVMTIQSLIRRTKILDADCVAIRGKCERLQRQLSEKRTISQMEVVKSLI